MANNTRDADGPGTRAVITYLRDRSTVELGAESQSPGPFMAEFPGEVSDETIRALRAAALEPQTLEQLTWLAYRLGAKWVQNYGATKDPPDQKSDSK